jgi:ABC-type multidrug transport system fused ATPase/permease subunit
MLHKDQSYLDTTNSSEIQSLQSDIQEVKSTLKKTITKGLSSTFQIIGSIISLLSTSLKLSFTIFTFLPLVYGGMSLYGKYLRFLSLKARRNEETVGFHLSQVYGNLKTVRAFVGEDIEIQKFNQNINNLQQTNLWLGIIS